MNKISPGSESADSFAGFDGELKKVWTILVQYMVNGNRNIVHY